MILAAADCADGKGPPPGELHLGWQARQWNALPLSGGLQDQPAGLLDRMAMAMRVHDAVTLYRASPPGFEGEFSKRHPDAWKVWLAVRELRGD